MNEIANELRRMHSSLAPCPGALGALCLRCQAAREIDRLTHEVRVLSRLLAEYMSQDEQNALTEAIAAMFHESEVDDVSHEFWD